MENLETVLFIGTVITGVTQFIKLLSPYVSGAVTIAAAVVVGIFVALLDIYMGVPNITVAEGITIALGAVGVTGTAKMIGEK